MINFTYDHKKEIFIAGNTYSETKHEEPYLTILRDIGDAALAPPVAYAARIANQASTDWVPLNANFLNLLGKFYDRELKVAELTAYLVRLRKFVYWYKSDNPWFTVPFFSYHNDRNRVIAHELIHYYQPVELPEPIKEAIPVILNDPKFGLKARDRGTNNEEEKQWRTKVWNWYSSGKTFYQTELSKYAIPSGESNN